MITKHHVGSTTVGITSIASNSSKETHEQKVNKTDSKCAEDVKTWAYYNDTKWSESEHLISKCANIEDTCCKQIKLFSPKAENSSDLVYSEKSKKSLGTYTAIGQTHGRYVYELQGEEERYLEFEENRGNWLIVEKVGLITGYIYHKGGSVCPENSGSKWHTAAKAQDGSLKWGKDHDLKAQCVDSSDETQVTGVKSASTSISTQASTSSSTTASSKTATTSSATSTTQTPSTTSTTLKTTKASTETNVLTTQKLKSVSSTKASSVTTETTTKNSTIKPHETNQTENAAQPLLSGNAESASSTTTIVVSLLIVGITFLLTFIFVRRFKTSWRNGAHGRQLVMETIGLYRSL